MKRQLIVWLVALFVLMCGDAHAQTLRGHTGNEDAHHAKKHADSHLLAGGDPVKAEDLDTDCVSGQVMEADASGWICANPAAIPSAVFVTAEDSTDLNTNQERVLGDVVIFRDGSCTTRSNVPRGALCLNSSGAGMWWYDGSTWHAASVTASSTFTVNDAATNTVSTALTVRHETSGTAAAGFGTRLSFEAEHAGNATEEQASVDVVLEDASDNAEDSQLVFRVRAGGGALYNHTIIDGDSQTVDVGDYDTTDTNSVDERLRLTHRTSATPAVGIGVRQAFVLDTPAGIHDAARETVELTNATNGSEASEINWEVLVGGSLAEVFRVRSAGSDVVARIHANGTSAGTDAALEILTDNTTDGNAGINFGSAGTPADGQINYDVPDNAFSFTAGGALLAQFAEATNRVALPARDTGVEPGPSLFVGRNTNASPRAAHLILEDKDGDDHYVWLSEDGDLCKSTSAPTNSESNCESVGVDPQIITTGFYGKSDSRIFPSGPIDYYVPVLDSIIGFESSTQSLNTIDNNGNASHGIPFPAGQINSFGFVIGDTGGASVNCTYTVTLYEGGSSTSLVASRSGTSWGSAVDTDTETIATNSFMTLRIQGTGSDCHDATFLAISMNFIPA